MNITSFLMKALAPSARSFERSTKDPRKAQEQTLLKYLSRNKRTEFGSKYDFSSIRSIEDFCSRLPISDHEMIRSYINRMKKGEANVLTADKVVFFGITSGTTGAPKLIPVTKYSDARKNALMDVWAYYTCMDHPNVFDGKILAIISPEVKSHTEAGIPYGPEDGHAYNNLLRIVKRLYVIPYQVFYIDNYDARYYCILRIAMEHNITTIATLNPSSLILLCQRIPSIVNKVIADIERGTLDASFDITADIRGVIERTLKPNPKRARELKELLKNNGELLPKHFWPRLDLIECWKGGTVKCYLQQLPQYFGNVAVRDFGCLSTEARSSIPMSDKGAGGVLAVQTNFYEFIPKNDINKTRKRTLLRDELEAGKEYLLIVTTAGGLYRYNIDDIIRVNGFFNKTPIIEFVQKGRNAVSITGEKIYESHINEAVTAAAAGTNVEVQNFCAVGVAGKGGTSRYVLLVEFRDKPSLAKKKKFLTAIDEGLRSQNSEYDDLRKQQLIVHPSLRVVKPGEFERYRRIRVSQGSHDTQFKMPKLALSSDFQKNFVVIEEITLR
jgi:hypothetical protein